jgi:DNA excision repair protein ERCC-2
VESDQIPPPTVDTIAENDIRFFFPYPSFRPYQEEVVRDINTAISAQKNVLLIASNGTGKTIMALSAILPIALKHKKKILFCSRTFTQNARVVEESKEISKYFASKKINQGLGVLSLRGRNEMCVHKMIKRLSLPPNESMSVCSSLRKNKKCQYFNAILQKKKSLEEDLNNLAGIPLDAKDLMDYADSRGMCPYFLSKILMRYVDIVVCNYQWIFEPNIRQTFMETLSTKIEDCIVILDECHNLPEMANDINSFRLSPYTLRQALKDLEITRADRKYINFIKSIKEMLEDVKGQVNEETTLDSKVFINQVLNKGHIASLNDLKIFLDELAEYSEAVQKDKLDQGDVSRDYFSPIIEFFQQFIVHMDDPAYFPCITVSRSSQGKSVSIDLFCMNPRLITDEVFKNAYATLSLSGTIHPFTFTELLGLNEIGRRLKIQKMPPPFPKENARIVLLSELTSRGENRTDSMYGDMIAALKPIVQYTPKNVGIFCASYEVLDGLRRNGFSEIIKACGKDYFIEQSESSASENDEMVQEYKACSKGEKCGAVLLGVCGGRNSEGEDFPADEMNSVVIVGVPFQRPTPSLEAKIKYYDILFPGKGRQFGYIVPAMQRANQACGRPIRRMTDRGFIVLMDFRFGNYRAYLSEWVAESMKPLDFNLAAIARELKFFFKG